VKRALIALAAAALGLLAEAQPAAAQPAGAPADRASGAGAPADRASGAGAPADRASGAGAPADRASGAGAPAEEGEDPEALLTRSLRLLGAGKYDMALELAERALTLTEEQLGATNTRTALALRRVAEVYIRKGDLQRAEPRLRRALAIYTAKGEESGAGAGAALFNLGEIAMALGDYAAAEEHLSRARGVFERLGYEGSMNLCVTLSILAQLYMTKADYAAAEPPLRRALSMLRKELRDAPLAYHELPQRLMGELHLRRGELDSAAPYLQAALSIIERARGQDHATAAYALDDLAELHLALGEPARAEALAERAVAIREQALGREHPFVARSLGLLASALAALGRLDDAVRTRARASDIEDKNGRINLAVGSEEQKRAYMATLRRSTDAIISLDPQVGPGALPGALPRALPRATNAAAARLALTVILRRKGLILDVMAESLGAMRARLDPGDIALLDELTSASSALSALASRGPRDMSAEEHRAQIQGLEAKRRSIEAELNARSSAHREAKRVVSLEEVQAAIPEGAALLELMRYEPFDPGAAQRGPKRPPGQPPRYAAYALRRRGEVASTDLGEASVIDAAVASLRRDLSDPARDPRRSAERLEAALMRPLRALLGGARWVLVSPDGALAMAPFGALVNEGGDYLIDHYAFTYVTSGRDLVRFAGPPPESREGPLVIADPNFGPLEAEAPEEDRSRGARSIDMGKVRFPPLRGTAGEGKAIAKVLPGARLLMKEEATEGALKASHRPRLLHVATHGFFLPDQTAGIENPLLRSGLALSGANPRQSGSDDGVLTALEAAGLDLRGTKLVVLSACETGVGDVRSGEGVYGLRRALGIAGAEAQVMSLWRVDDAVTRDLMVEYYGLLAAGGGRSEALRAVQRSMIRRPDRAHPYYWAGFIVSGNAAALDGQLAPPDFSEVRGKVDPGPRGCNCEVAVGARGSRGGRDGGGAGEGIAALALLVIAAAARRRQLTS
jgi:CHAT domain-containing protein